MRCFALAALLLATAPLAAAQTASPALRVEPQPGGAVYLYLSRTPAGPGIHVWRSTDGSAPVRLTDAPLARVTDTDALPSVLGGDFAEVSARMGTPDAVAILARLGRRSFDSEVLVRLYPGAARVAGRLFVDESAQPGVRYTYRLGSGSEAGGAEVSVSAGATVAPAPVNALAATRDEFEVTLSWRYAPGDANSARADAVPGVAFGIVRTDEASGEEVSVSAEPLVALTSTPDYTFADTTALATRAYRYAVVARSASGLPGPAREVTVAPAPDRTAPLAVQNVRADEPEEAEARSAVTLTWDASPEADLAGYHVYRSPVQPGAVPRRLTAAPLTATTFADLDVQAGERYGYTVRALDFAGNESAPSVAAIAIVPIPIPPTPTGLRARADATGAQLSWSNAQGSTTALRLIRQQTARYDAPIAEEPYLPVGRYDATRTSASDPAASEPGARYRYALVALDANDAPSDTAFVEVAVPDREPPPAPAALRAASVLARRVEITAEPSRAPDAARHILTRAAVGMGAADTLAVVYRRAEGPLPTIRYDDASAVLGQRYVYTLVAEDRAGNRSRAARDTVHVADGTPPPAPRLPDAREEAGRVRITWLAAPADDLAGYHVYRADAPGIRAQRLTPAPTMALAWDGPAATGWYTVRAVDTSGNESEPSVPVQVAGL